MKVDIYVYINLYSQGGDNREQRHSYFQKQLPCLGEICILSRTNMHASTHINFAAAVAAATPINVHVTFIADK